MITSTQLSPGLTISVDGAIYRVESVVKVTAPKGTPFVKAKLKDLTTFEVIEKNFKTNQKIHDVSLVEQELEFLYQENKDFLFLDIHSLEKIMIASKVVGDHAHFLKEGTRVHASFYKDEVFAIELPQFLELMVAKTENPKGNVPASNATKIAVLESGARVDVPPFIESGDIIKVDTRTAEYIQRV